MALLRHRLFAAGVLAMPLALALVMAGPGMLTEAAGCSGGPAFVWASLSWDGDDTAPVDAVVVLKGKGNGIYPSTPSVSLVDGSGSPVSGLTVVTDLGGPTKDRSFAVRSPQTRL